MTPVFHSGELEVQRRMGQAGIAERVARSITADIPAKAAAFLTEQPTVIIAAAADNGAMWISPISGPPGFARTDGPRTIELGALPVSGDPLGEALQGPRRVGLLALEPQTRRRMRVNGAAEPAGDGLRVHTDQVYSNCPKYIARRNIEKVDIGASPSPACRTAALNAIQERAITAADTFFIGSADADGNADASHRGGNPGFLQVISPTRLRWPDYRGNSMFMTLGNIAVNARCALLVVGWRTGGTIHITGTAKINWDEDTLALAAQCWIDFTISEVVEVANASPLRWGTAELSPANPA